MIHPTPSGFELPLMLLEGLDAAARDLIKKNNRRPPKARAKVGCTLRPGPQMPMWAALAQAVRPHLRAYGAKSKLARLLGVPPQRISEFLASQRAAPDAERTLRLLHWLSQRQRGLNPG